MQGIFKNGNQLIVNGADSDERILVDNFYNALNIRTNTLKLDQVLDINGDTNGLMFSIVNNELPDIVAFPLEKVTINKGESQEITIQTKPGNCVCYVSTSDSKIVTANSVESLSTVNVNAVEVGTAKVNVILEAAGYNNLSFSFEVEVVQGE